MVTVRGFAETYGLPRVSVVTLPLEGVTVPFSFDRYLLVFIAGTVNPIDLRPLGTSEGGVTPIVLQPGAREVFHFSAHGTLPCLGWSVTPEAGPNTVTLVEGFAPPNLLPTLEVENGRDALPHRAPAVVGGGGVGDFTPRLHPEAGPDLLGGLWGEVLRRLRRARRP